VARSRLNERLSIVATIDPASVSAGTAASDVVKMDVHREVAFILLTGALGTSATVDLKLQASATSGGTYADISGKSITQMVKASNDNDQVTINLRSSEMPAGKAFVKAVATVGTAASIISLVAVAENDRFEPANATQLASVVQNVA
jgi:Rieske Fe-S protein